MLAGRLIKHWRTAHYFKNTEMWLICRDVGVVSQCLEMELRLNREEEEETMERVELFKYLGRPLYQSDNDWLVVRRNIRKENQVWSRLGVILRWEGSDPITSAEFYRAVVQAVLLFGAETWVLSAAM